MPHMIIAPQQRSRQAEPPGPGWLSLARHLPSAWRNPLPALVKARERYGDVLLLGPIPGRRVYLLCHPDYIRHILLENYTNYEKDRLYRLFEVGFGQGLLISGGDLWKRQRRMMQPTFNQDALGRFLPVIADSTADRIETWTVAASQGSTVDVATEMLAIVRRAMLHTLVSADLGAQVELVRRAFLRAVRPSLLTGSLFTPQGLRFSAALSRLRFRLEEIIEARRADPHPPMDMLSQLMLARDRRSGIKMDDAQLLSELITLIFTGYETVAQALVWALHLLAKHPRAQEKVHVESLRVLGSGAPSLERVNDLSYTQMVLEETLRLFPPAWANGRRALGPDSIGGYTIGEGSLLVYSQYVVHRHPRFWVNPNEFDPERFSRGANRGYHEFAYFPFGAGPRRCIGREFALLEAKLVLAMVLQRYALEPPSNAAVAIDPTVTLQPRFGLPLRLRRRLV